MDKFYIITGGIILVTISVIIIVTLGILTRGIYNTDKCSCKNVIKTCKNGSVEKFINPGDVGTNLSCSYADPHTVSGLVTFDGTLNLCSTDDTTIPLSDSDVKFLKFGIVMLWIFFFALIGLAVYGLRSI